MSDPDEHPSAAAESPRIEVQCLSCGRHGAFEGDDRRVSHTPLVQLTKRLRCSACGSRAVKATAIRTPRDVARLLRSRMEAGGS